MTDILEVSASEPKDFRGIVAVNDALDIFVIAMTDDCREHDLFASGTGPDEHGIHCEESLDVGLYAVQFRPWSHQGYDGDYDCGIDLADIKNISQVPAEFLLSPAGDRGAQAAK